LGTFALLIILRVPVAFALGVSSLVAAAAIKWPISTIAQWMADALDSTPLMAIPFFILAGEIMAAGGVAKRLVDLANIFVGWIRGGLAMVNVLASMFFGGVSGSSVADTSSVGSIMIPMMVEEGYERDFSVAITVSGSTQGIIIPPSHNAIIYALAAGGAVSIAKLFLAGIIPGVMIGLSLMVASYIIAKKRGYPCRKIPFKNAGRVVLHGLLGLLIGVIIIGGIISGIFTATEASAVAVIYAFILVFFIYRSLPLRALPGILLSATRTIGIVLLLIATSNAFSRMLALMHVPQLATQAFLAISQSRWVVLLLINILLLLIGMVMDMAPAILILTPILLPVAENVGVDPVHFGIIMMINLAIGLCTPPVGATLFVGCSVGKTKIEEVTRALLPLYPAMIAVLFLVTYIPQVAMFIPRLFEHVTNIP